MRLMTHRPNITTIFAKRTLPSWVYKGMLLLAAAVWGLGTVAVKDTVSSFPPTWLVGIRFIAAGLILCVVCAPRMIRTMDRETLVAGCFLGVLVGASFLTNTVGIAHTTASKSSFLTATYCVMVPFIAWAVSRQRPTRYNLVAALVCIIGVACVSLSGAGSGAGLLSLTFGDAITLASACVLGFHLAFQAKLAAEKDALVLTAIQFVVGGIIGAAFAFATEGPVDMTVLADPSVLGNLVYLVVFASCLALSLQNVGLAHVPAAPASLFLATESVFGVIFSVMLLGEIVTPPMLLGFVLIGAGIVISEALPARKQEQENRPLEQELEN